MAVVILVLGVLLLSMKSKRKKEVGELEALIVAYKKEGEVHIGPPEVEMGGGLTGERNKPEEAPGTAQREEEEECYVDAEYPRGSLSSESENIYDMMDN